MRRGLEKKKIMGAAEGREPWLWKKARKRESRTQGITQGEHFPEPSTRKKRGADIL